MIYQTKNFGTLPYNSPEQFNPTGVDEISSDIKAEELSLGVIIYQTLFLKLPFSAKNQLKHEDKIRREDFVEIDGPLDLKTLIRDLLKTNPDDPMKYSKIKQLSFLNEYFDAHENGTLFKLLAF